MKIEQIEESTWDIFIRKQPYTFFVQSSLYKKFYERMGEGGVFFGVYDDQNNLCGGSLCLSVKAKRGSFLYLPYGPILPLNSPSLCSAFFDTVFNYAKKEGLCAVRISPFVERKWESYFASLGFYKSPLHILAERSVIIDLAKTEEELLQDMNKNHRNLIRRCQREGVRVIKTSNKTDLNDLNSLLTKTSERHKFHRFSDSYIEKEFDTFLHKDGAYIYKAFLPDGRLDSAAVILRFGNMGVYRHSGSLGLDPRLPTSYALQWQVIQDLKKEGFSKYNMWGIAPENAHKNHPFSGITHFKKGFGGTVIESIPCMDKPLSVKYAGLYIVDFIRKIIRGF